VDLVGVLQEEAHQRVSQLVIGRDRALLLREQARFLLRARDHAHDPFLQLCLPDRFPAPPRRQERRLVDHVCEIRPREPRGCRRQHVQIDLPPQRFSLCVNPQDLLPPIPIWPVDHDLPVEPPRAQERRIEDVRPVRGRDQDDVVLHLEPVHLHQQLVQRLLALVIAAAHARPAMATDRIDLVDEDDARTRLLRLLEQVADSRRTYTHEHLHEVRAGNREERHSRLTGRRACQQRFPRPRRPI